MPSTHEKIREAAESEGLAFNSDEERAAARGHLLQAIRNIDPGERAASRKRVAEYSEIPRIRQITGNIIDLTLVEPSTASVGDFIHNDRAALFAIDQEILSARPEPGRKTTKTALQRRRENAADAQKAMEALPRDRKPVANRGGYQ